MLCIYRSEVQAARRRKTEANTDTDTDPDAEFDPWSIPDEPDPFADIP